MNNLVLYLIIFLVYIIVPVCLYKNSHKKRKTINQKKKGLFFATSFGFLFMITIIILDIYLIFYVNNNGTYFGLQPLGLFGLNVCVFLPVFILNLIISILSIKEFRLWRKNI